MPSKGFPFSQQRRSRLKVLRGDVATVSIGGSGIDLAQQQNSSTAGQKLPLHYNLHVPIFIITWQNEVAWQLINQTFQNQIITSPILFISNLNIQ